MPEKNAALGLLLKVFDDLSDFLPYLVLVGGWVPYLYAHYLWKGIQCDPLTTVDIDFGFKDAPEHGSGTIADRVRREHYGEHHISMDRSVPFVPVVRLGKGGLRADVEFITAPETPEKVKNKLVGREIKINEIGEFNILLEDPLKINIEGRRINIPRPALFVFHKLLTFVQRERIDKLQKDLYYAYYVLFFSPEREKLAGEISELISHSKAGRRVRNNIERYFEDALSKGTAYIAATTQGSLVTTLVSDVRQDAFERIFSLLR